MFNIRNILFPIEFSRRDELVAPFVLSMAQRYRARIVALHVYQAPIPVYAGTEGIYPEAFDWSAATGPLAIHLRKFADAQLPGVEGMRREPG